MEIQFLIDTAAKAQASMFQAHETNQQALLDLKAKIEAVVCEEFVLLTTRVGERLGFDLEGYDWQFGGHNDFASEKSLVYWISTRLAQDVSAKALKVDGEQS